MDPITIAIVAALVGGIAEGFAAEAYKALTTAIKKKYGKDSKIAQAIDTVEEEPDFEPNQQALTGRIEQMNAAQDPELVKLAQALIDALQETAKGQEALGKYNINVQNSEVGNIGDHAHIPGGIHFGETKNR